MSNLSFTEKIKLAMRFKFMEIHERENESETFPIIPLKDMLDDIIKISDITWGSQYAFSRDPIEGKVSLDDKIKLTEEAIKCGECYAKTLRDKYGKSSCRELIDKLNLKYEEKRSVKGQWRAVFAEFEEPNIVRVYSDYALNAQESYETVKDKLNGIEIIDVLIAHELFHYLEKRDQKHIFTKTHKIILWDIKIARNSSQIMCLSEIAAMAFCKELLGLKYSPFVFDIILSYTVNSKLANKLHRELLSFDKIHPTMKE